MPDRQSVTTAFDRGAPSYDRLVGANPGYHTHLRLSAERLARRLGPGGGQGIRLLDAGCGTGASTRALLRALPGASIVAVDGSAGMLAQARAKTWPSSVRFVHSRIEELADLQEPAGAQRFADAGQFDAVFAAYLIRNLPDPDSQLDAFRRLLRPGGSLALHEYSVRDSRYAKAMWNLVATAVIVPSGRWVSGDAELYRYLRRSVNDFDGISALHDRLRRSGFDDVDTATVPGWQRGIVHTVIAGSPR